MIDQKMLHIFDDLRWKLFIYLFIYFVNDATFNCCGSQGGMMAEGGAGLIAEANQMASAVTMQVEVSLI